MPFVCGIEEMPIGSLALGPGVFNPPQKLRVVDFVTFCEKVEKVCLFSFCAMSGESPHPGTRSLPELKESPIRTPGGPGRTQGLCFQWAERPSRVFCEASLTLKIASKQICPVVATLHVVAPSQILGPFQVEAQETLRDIDSHRKPIWQRLIASCHSTGNENPQQGHDS